LFEISDPAKNAVVCCLSFKTVTPPAQLSSAPPSALQYDREGSREGIGDILTAMTIHPSHSRPAASPAMSTRLLGVYRQCVERGIWARIQLETRGGVEEVTFSCCETAVFPKKTKKRPPNARRQQYNRERREAWLNKQKIPASGSGPTSAASATAAAKGAAATKPTAEAAAAKTTAAVSVTAAPYRGAAAAKATAAASATAEPLTGAAEAKTTAATSATAAPATATAAPATAAATATGEAATATPPRKKMKAPDATKCSSRSTVTAKRQAMAYPENQRAATDPNNDLDLALNLDLDLDRDLDSPKATAISATAVVPGTAAPAAPSCTPPKAPNLKK
jgi:hypothetical protein